MTVDSSAPANSSPKQTAKATVAKQDICFVNAWQVAEVKLYTSPNTRYGMLSARVDVVTANTVTDESNGFHYPVILALNQKVMDIDRKRIPLSTGINITAEIKTGKRQVIEYLLNFAQKADSESLREI